VVYYALLVALSRHDSSSIYIYDGAELSQLSTIALYMVRVWPLGLRYV
jgi:hypothetical protein